MKKFIFDVDGTLTPSRQMMDKEFSYFFETFCRDNPVYLVTGSDKQKTVEQLGEHIYNLTQLSFNCAGNEVWCGTDLLYKNDWIPSTELISYLETELSRSQFHTKTGKHIEVRNGMLNFSIIGRNCTLDQRYSYVDWDKQTNERHLVAVRVRSLFDADIDVYIGGETGLDIFKKNYGKAQTIPKIKTDEDDILYYFGDQIFPGGNDYDAAILCDHYHQVESWSDTYDKLLFIQDLMS